MRSKIYFDDLVVLRVIGENQSDTEYVGVPLIALPDMANDWKKIHKVPDNYMPEFSKGMSVIQKSLYRLRKLGLVKRISARKGNRTTDKANELFERIGEDWRKWFLSVPVSNSGEILFEQAKYADQYRESL